MVLYRLVTGFRKAFIGLTIVALTLDMVNKVATPGQVILVTGGCGFLGHHIVQLLAEKADNVSEIRVLDICSRPDFIKTDNKNIKIRYIRGDIRDAAVVGEVVDGADAVIHAAAVTDTRRCPEMDLLYSVNVMGTSEILKACIKKNVEYLIYTSSSEVKRGYESRIDATEVDISRVQVAHSDLVLTGYSSTKYQAEEMVLNANNTKLNNGKCLKTIALRPCGIYGEGDVKYVTSVIKTGKQCMGILPVLGSTDARVQRVYVGNVAWAHVTTLFKMKQDPSVTGETYHVTDGTPLNNNFHWMKPFLETQKVKVLPIAIPLPLVYYVWAFIEMLVWLVSPLLKIELIANRNELFLCCTTCYYSGTKARTRLGYKPLYTAKEAFSRSYEYYASLKV